MDEANGWRALLAAAEAAPEAPVRFRAGGRTIGGGLHVTEVRRARIDAVDCGSGRAAWGEVQMQLLEGWGDAPMRGRTLAGIVRRSAAALDLPGDAVLRVEAAPSGGGLGLYRVAAIGTGEDAVVVTLAEMGPECRPASLGCCAPAPACCG